MKKIALSLAVVATLGFVACGNKANTEDTAAADTMQVTEEVAVAADSNESGAATAVVAEETVAPVEEAAKADSPKAEEPKAEEKK